MTRRPAAARSEAATAPPPPEPTTDASAVSSTSPHHSGDAARAERERAARREQRAGDRAQRAHLGRGQHEPEDTTARAIDTTKSRPILSRHGPGCAPELQADDERGGRVRELLRVRYLRS